MSFSHLLQKITTLLNLIKFSHTIFSFPFAVMSAFLAASGMPGMRQLLLIIAALVMARSAAMSFNRLVDTHYDINNPRTTYRVTLQKKIGRTNLWMFTILCATFSFSVRGCSIDSPCICLPWPYSSSLDTHTQRGLPIYPISSSALH